MRAILAGLAALAMAGGASQAAAQAEANWGASEVSSGTASLDTPCGTDAVTGVQDQVELIACNWDGFQIVLLVMPEGEWEIDGVTDRPYEQTREQLLADENTDYVTDVEMANTRAFFAEGTSSNGKVGTAMVDLNAGRILVLLVQSDGTEATEQRLNKLFAQVWGSLEVQEQ